MQIEFKNMLSILPDNEVSYFRLLEGIINSIDTHSYLMITKTPSGYLFRISPSDASLINLIIEELNSMHNLLQISLKYSKSMKSASSISWSLDILS